LAAAGVTVRRTQPRSPNLQAHVERWIQSLRVECLDRILALGEPHLNQRVREYVAHFNTERPHQSLGNRLPSDAGEPGPDVLPFPAGGVVCPRRPGGLLRHDRRAA
jgi:transposase InsO family protein